MHRGLPAMSSISVCSSFPTVRSKWLVSEIMPNVCYIHPPFISRILTLMFPPKWHILSDDLFDSRQRNYLWLPGCLSSSKPCTPTEPTHGNNINRLGINQRLHAQGSSASRWRRVFRWCDAVPRW
ncbi:hypothetical protein M427DRAFT_374346 [Gonapodya prolifera JEL478]|uniref:Uncharacterized protein n=1 Tax=Gonapodya prolifera (strain JEL478) TaxID=1344416 RepID=A0A139AUG7_GONPJ|nr:hypothetical protein M427DRAFT_374346 [Gonapodya prolifera JEL478]|eukprot:KXS20386.1 hypothetical protein M427DRAFT_374346 [Gonapodya prolifera JEL478]